MITVIIAIFCLILGAGLVYLFMRPKVKVTQKEDKEILEKNKAVQFELQAMEQRTDYLKEQYEQKLQEYKKLKQDSGLKILPLVYSSNIEILKKNTP